MSPNPIELTVILKAVAAQDELPEEVEPVADHNVAILQHTLGFFSDGGE
jgi:hypothetical protein